MLTELRIENFAIIDHLELEFGPGLITLTGETGAGKSIIVDAVETLLGMRVDSTLIRTGVEHSSVEGSFHISELVREIVHSILKREELLDDPEYVVLRREFRRGGRNIARVNGRTVNLGLLRELGELLIDLHGQSEHLSLLRVRNHLGLLDRFAENDDILSEYRGVYSQLMDVRKELSGLRQAESDAARRSELLEYQIEEIAIAKLKAGEEEILREERTRLANAENLANLGNLALSALDDTSPIAPSATDRLGEVVSLINSLVKVDETQTSMLENAQELFDGLTDLAVDLRKYLESIEFDPAKLEEVEERLDLLHNLKRKYGEKITDILTYKQSAQKELEAIISAEKRIELLETKEQENLRSLVGKGEALSAKRRESAIELSNSIEKELRDLRMEDARFKVDFSTRPDPDGVEITEGEGCIAFDAQGFEKVEFLVEPNPGEGLKPLVKIASGGETARLMLGLKNVLVRADHTPTLIFDEIDQGIGGRVGAVVGQKLWNLGQQHQVLCVTHLPQLAGYGEEHFKVGKVIEGGRTTTRVERLDYDARLVELANMLGDVSEGTLQSAREILQSVNETVQMK
jgi:DNA repair protein RecN (Recombination protein N)